MAKNKNAKTKAETKKETVKSQVENTAKETSTAEVSKNVEATTETTVATATEVKEEKSKTEAPKTEQKKEKKATTVTVVPEVVNEPRVKVPTNIPVGSAASSFDAKARLATVMHERYACNNELKERYPEFYEAMSRNLDVVVVLALTDLRNEIITKNERGELKLTVKPEQVLQLQEAAAMVGIELAPAKALPGPDSQLEINFTESKIPEALTEKKAATEEKVELDPHKITSNEEVVKALNHLLTKGKNIAENVVNTVEWYRVYCGLKEENAEKKLELDNRTVGEWLQEIFNLTPATVIFNGLGQAIYNYTCVTGNPIKGHCILHGSLSKNNLGWSEEQIADLAKCFITGKYKLKVANKEASEDPTKNKAMSAIIGNLGVEFVDKLFADSKNEKDEAAKQLASQTISVVKSNYFKRGEAVTEDELRLKIGQIINLYRDPMDRIAECAFYCSEAKKEAEQSETEKKN